MVRRRDAASERVAVALKLSVHRPICGTNPDTRPAVAVVAPVRVEKTVETILGSIEKAARREHTW